MSLNRRHMRVVVSCATMAIVLTTTGHVPAAAPSVWRFQVAISEDVYSEPFSGRVYLLFGTGDREPRQSSTNWFRPGVIVSRDVENWMPGETIEFHSDRPDEFLAFPKTISELDLAGHRVQALVRFDAFERNINRGANGYSAPIELETSDEADETAVVRLTVDKKIAPREFRDTEWSKLLQLRSELLSKFYGRDVVMNACVILPASYYDKPEQRYPTIFTIPGFGGTHFNGSTTKPIKEENERGVEFLRVLLDPSCPRGHHVFADSANNGPVGQALVEELIPEFDRQFRSIAEPGARFLNGHSSGGWSSLWLQVTYPETFGGTWSTAPDPVDFRDFQQINLYNPGENMYVDENGERRPLARSRNRVVLWYEDFAKMEWALGYGGQLHSFEAVFSPRGEDGTPLLVWDRETGEINTAVADRWKPYDIRLILEENWDTLEPKLQGKLHVFMGDRDTFYLEGATILLKESMEKLGSEAVVEIHPDRDHGSLMTAELRSRIRSEIVSAFLSQFPEYNNE